MINTSKHTNHLEKWKKGPLKRFGYFISGTGFPHEYQGVTDGDFPFYKVDDMNSSGSDGFITVATNTIDQKTVKQLGAKIAPRSTIIFPKVGAALLSNKRRVLQIPGVFDNNILGFVPTYGDVRYWYYLLLTIDLGRLCNPGPVPSVNESQVGSMPLTIPPESEQKWIAAFLDQQTAKLDELVEKKQLLIDLLQEKRQALITQAVTKGLDPNVPMKDSGIEWLGEVPAHWNIEKLKFFVNIYGGGTPAKDNLEYWNGDIPWVSPKDMKTELIYSTEEYITEKGLANSTTTLIDRKSVLVVVRSGILKRSLPVAINVVPVSLNQDIKAIIPKRHVTVDYLGWVFKGLSHFILYLCKKEGATVDSIEVDDLLKMPIPFPIKEEQDFICQYLQYETGKLDCLISKLESQIYKIQEYRQALITAAVTGQIDVRENAEPIPAGKE